MSEKVNSDHNQKFKRLLKVCKDLNLIPELDSTLNTVIETASELTASEWSQIFIFDHQKKFLQVLSAPFFMLEALKTIAVSIDHSIAGSVMVSQQVVSYHVKEDDGRLFQSLDWEANQKARSVLAAPIFYHGEIIGVLESINKQNDAAYLEEDVFFLEVLAAQAASAIEIHRMQIQTDRAIQKASELECMKRDFIAIASHELRTPLGLILGHASFLKENASPQQEADIDVINRSALRMKDLIEEFGDIDAFTSGFSRVKRDYVHLEKLVPNVVESMRPLAIENKINLLTEIKHSNLTVEGDSEKIMLALRNLIKNALVFTNSGGVVKVAADTLPGYVKIAVMDSGIGIPSSELQNIFNRFYQVEKHLTRKHGGMGLGLSVARDMVEMHGGKILVESIEDKGSRFTIMLPLNAAQASAAERVFLS